MPVTKKHQDYTSYIMSSVRSINPHTTNQGHVGYVYAVGFLASYLASILEDDPIQFKQFKKHIESVSKRQS